MANLCDITDIELYLLSNYSGNPSDVLSDNNRVEMTIESISAEIETICNRHFLVDDYEEIYDGTGGRTLLLNQYPINSISNITYGDGFDPDNKEVLTSNTDYIFDSVEGIVRFSFSLSEGYQALTVNYNAGYTEVPYDLKLICVKWVVSELYATDQNMNLKSEKLGDATNTYFTSSEKKELMTNDLKNYIRYDI